VDCRVADGRFHPPFDSSGDSPCKF
jgi:hypothetical protein